MYDVSVQDIDERMINVHYYYYKCGCDCVWVGMRVEGGMLRCQSLPLSMSEYSCVGVGLC